MGWSHDKWERYVRRRVPAHVHNYQLLLNFYGGTKAVPAPFEIAVCPDCRRLRIAPFEAFEQTDPQWRALLKQRLVNFGYGLHVDAAFANREPSESVAREAQP